MSYRVVRRRRLLGAGCSLVVAALPLQASPAVAADDYCTPARVGNVNNGATWYAYAPQDEDGSSNGWASFDEYGEILRVRDNDSDGRRIQVAFARCDVGWSELYFYDSGPDEGPIDQESYDLDIPEGVRVRFSACLEVAWRCGEMQRSANA